VKTTERRNVSGPDRREIETKGQDVECPVLVDSSLAAVVIEPGVERTIFGEGDNVGPRHVKHAVGAILARLKGE